MRILFFFKLKDCWLGVRTVFILNLCHPHFIVHNNVTLVFPAILTSLSRWNCAASFLPSFFCLSEGRPLKIDTLPAIFKLIDSSVPSIFLWIFIFYFITKKEKKHLKRYLQWDLSFHSGSVDVFVRGRGQYQQHIFKKKLSRDILCWSYFVH